MHLPASGTHGLLELHELAAAWPGRREAPHPLATEALLAGGAGVANQTRADRNETRAILKVRLDRPPPRRAARAHPPLKTTSPSRLANSHAGWRTPREFAVCDPSPHLRTQAHVAPPPSRPSPLRPSPVQLPPLRADAAPDAGEGDEEVSPRELVCSSMAVVWE